MIFSWPVAKFKLSQENKILPSIFSEIIRGICLGVHVFSADAEHITNGHGASFSALPHLFFTLAQGGLEGNSNSQHA